MRVSGIQPAHLRIDDRSGDHQGEELFGWSRDGRSQGLSDLHRHLGDATDQVVRLFLVLLGGRHVVESRRLTEFWRGVRNPVVLGEFEKCQAGFIAFAWH